MWRLGLVGLTLFIVVACGPKLQQAPPAPEAVPPSATVKAPNADPALPDMDVNTAYNFEGLPEPYGLANYNIGRRVFRLCATCHFLKADMGNSVGPNLNGIFDRKAGTLPKFQYSKALQAAEFKWTPEKLDQWLQGPRDFLPGNRMIFQGVRKENERVAVIAYIMKETGYLPDATPTITEN